MWGLLQLLSLMCSTCVAICLTLLVVVSQCYTARVLPSASATTRVRAGGSRANSLIARSVVLVVQLQWHVDVVDVCLLVDAEVSALCNSSAQRRLQTTRPCLRMACINSIELPVKEQLIYVQ